MGNGASADSDGSGGGGEGEGGFGSPRVGAAAALRSALTSYPGVNGQQRHTLFKHQHMPRGGFQHNASQRRPPRLEHLGTVVSGDAATSHLASATTAAAAAASSGKRKSKKKMKKVRVARQGDGGGRAGDDGGAGPWSSARGMAQRRRNGGGGGGGGSGAVAERHFFAAGHSASAVDHEMYHILNDAAGGSGLDLERKYPLQGMHERQVAQNRQSGQFRIRQTEMAKRAARVVHTMLQTRKPLRWKSLDAKINKRRATTGASSVTPKGTFSAVGLLDGTAAAHSRLGGSGVRLDGGGDDDGGDGDTSSDGSDGEGNALGVIPTSPIALVSVGRRGGAARSFSPRASLSGGDGGGSGGAPVATAAAAAAADDEGRRRLPAITSPISRGLMERSARARAGDVHAAASDELTAAQRHQQQRQHAALLASLRGQPLPGSDRFAGAGPGGGFAGAAAAARARAASASPSPSRGGVGQVVPAPAGAMRELLEVPRSLSSSAAAASASSRLLPGASATAARQFFFQQQQRQHSVRGRRDGGAGEATTAAAAAAAGTMVLEHDDGAALARSTARPDEWACPVCTFINPRIMEVCEMCETPRPGGRLHHPQHQPHHHHQQQQQLQQLPHHRAASASLSDRVASFNHGASGNARLPVRTHSKSSNHATRLHAALPSLARDGRDVGGAVGGGTHSAGHAAGGGGSGTAAAVAAPARIPAVQLHGATPTSLFLMWEPPTADGGAPVVGYILEGRPTAAAASGAVTTWRRLYFGIARNYLATNLEADTEYAVRVAAINSEGQQASFSVPAAHRTLDDPTAEQGFEIPPLRVWGLWAEYWDPPSNSCYYYNRQTRASAWDMPPGMKAATAAEEEDKEEEDDDRKEEEGGGEGGGGEGDEVGKGGAVGQAGHKPGGQPSKNKRKKANKPTVSFKMKRYRVLMNLRTDEFQGFHELSIRRDVLLADSFGALNQLTPDQWRRKLKILFKHEDGMDAGGLSKDWFLQLSRAACEPGSGLFQAGPSGLLMPAPAAAADVRAQCRRLEVFGLFMAKAIRDRQVLDVPLCHFVLKHVLGLQDTLNLKDVADIDPQLSQSLAWMQDNPVNDLGLDMFFTVSVASAAANDVREQDLLPGGSKRLVTEENKHQYVQLLVEWYTQKASQVQLKFLCRGFHALIPLDVIKVFTVAELRLLLNSTEHIDVQNGLRAGATFSNGLAAMSEVVLWFWEVVDGFTAAEQCACLEFITGCSKVPLDGFVPPLCLCGTDSGPEALPRAHTCFNQLLLPSYTSIEQLREKLSYAMRNSRGFQFA